MINRLNYRCGSLLDRLQAPEWQRIFVHDYSELGIPSLAARSRRLSNIRAERALLLAQPGDMVIVSEAVAPEYLKYLDQIGIGPGHSNVIAAQAISTAGQSKGVFELAQSKQVLARVDELVMPGKRLAMNVFFGGEVAQRFCEIYARELDQTIRFEAGQPEATVSSNRKDTMRSVALKLGVPVATGEIVTATDYCELERSVCAAVERNLMDTGGVMIRAAWSGGGLDNRVVTDSSEFNALHDWLGERKHIQTYLVESLLDICSSPNVQMWITHDGICEVMEVTNQRLDEWSTHVGNESPYQVEEPLITDAAKIGCYLSEQGYRGPLGLDFLKTHAGDYRFVEVNGRINGATYCIALTSRINQQRARMGIPKIEAWIGTKKLSSRAANYATLHETVGDLLYLPYRDEGVVPYNSGQLAEGGISFVILADSVARAKHIELRLAERLAA